jgi:hypothetical protein
MESAQGNGEDDHPGARDDVPARNGLIALVASALLESGAEDIACVDQKTEGGCRPREPR